MLKVAIPSPHPHYPRSKQGLNYVAINPQTRPVRSVVPSGINNNSIPKIQPPLFPSLTPCPAPFPHPPISRLHFRLPRQPNLQQRQPPAKLPLTPCPPAKLPQTQGSVACPFFT